MIAATLPSERRHLPVESCDRDPIGAGDVADVLGSVTEQLFDIAGHFEQVGRDKEAFALYRVALDIGARSVFFRTTAKLNSTKPIMSIVVSLRAAGTIDRDTLQALREVVSGRYPKAPATRRLLELFRAACRKQVEAAQIV